jgi:uncharacterized protein YgiM (DUF1202 family)
MVRLTLLLCVSLFIAMLVAGSDSETKRFGLMAQNQPARAVIMPMALPEPAQPETAAVAAVMPPDTAVILNAAFMPDAPVMVAPEPLDLAQPSGETQVKFATDTTGRVLRVTANGLNVRDGPGKDYAVVGRLRRGDEVLVVVEAETKGGWALIRIEGDGVEGYVASRLLAE